MQSSKEQQGEVRKTSQSTMQRNRGKQKNGKDQRSLEENQRYQGTFHVKIGTIHYDGNSKDLTEVEEIKKRLQEYTEELYKIGLHDPHNNYDVITHSESDFLECEVNWPQEELLGTKLMEVMEFQLSYFNS